jgi:hypothetical protein
MRARFPSWPRDHSRRCQLRTQDVKEEGAVLRPEGQQRGGPWQEREVFLCPGPGDRHCVRESQRAGGRCCGCDSERVAQTLTRDSVERLGPRRRLPWAHRLTPGSRRTWVVPRRGPRWTKRPAQPSDDDTSVPPPNQHGGCVTVCRAHLPGEPKETLAAPKPHHLTGWRRLPPEFGSRTNAEVPSQKSEMSMEFNISCCMAMVYAIY